MLTKFPRQTAAICKATGSRSQSGAKHVSAATTILWRKSGQCCVIHRPLVALRRFCGSSVSCHLPAGDSKLRLAPCSADGRSGRSPYSEWISPVVRDTEARVATGIHANWRYATASLRANTRKSSKRCQYLTDIIRQGSRVPRPVDSRSLPQT